MTNEVDMIKATEPKSDQLNADSLAGGLTLTIKVTSVKSGTDEQPVIIHYEGDNGKPYKPCKSMNRVLKECWGVNTKQYVGRSMTLYCDPEVRFGPLKVGGIRISHLSDIKKTMNMVLTASQGKKKPFTVKPLKIEEAAPVEQASEELIMAGNEAAEGGVDSYTKWKDGLDAGDKALIKPHHNGWSKIATAADAEESPAI